MVPAASRTGAAVGRKPDPERRAELLQDVVAYLLDRGIHQTSLRPLANELGTSTYTFVYHFGSKEELVTQALGQVAKRTALALGEFGKDGSVDAFVHDWWDWNVNIDSLRTARVLTDARSLVRVQPQLFRPFVERAREDLSTALTQRLLAEDGSAEDAPMMVATLTGALSELVGAEGADRGAATVERLLAAVA
jgi:AcrR family transcriptional regulator